MYIPFDPPLNTGMTYTREMRQSVIDGLRRGMTVKAVSAEVGIGTATIYTWRRSDPVLAKLLAPKVRRKEERISQLETPLTLGLRKTAEELRRKRLADAQEVGEYYREISLQYALLKRPPDLYPVRPRSLPPE